MKPAQPWNYYFAECHWDSKLDKNEIHKFLSWHFASMYYALCALAVTVPHQAGGRACL